MLSELAIRDARLADLPGVLDILNHYILHHHCTFDVEPWRSEQKRAWLESCSDNGPHRLLVGESDTGLLGYAHSARWRPKAAYEVTVETTVYVAHDHHGRGVGTALMQELLRQLRSAGTHSAVAAIAQPNPASNRLHEMLGFRRIGTFRQVGYKFDRYWDVTWWQIMLDDHRRGANRPC